MPINHILFLASGYPSKAHLYHGAFVKELVHAFARLGKRCTVIRPVKFHEGIYNTLPPYCLVESEAGQTPVTVISPKILSFSNKKIFNFNTFKLTQMSFEAAVIRALSKIQDKPDAVYGHFLYPAGVTAIKIGKKLDIPSFAAVGEGVFWTVRPLGFERARRDYQDVCGVVAVSSLLKKKIIDQIKVPSEKIEVFPNGANLARFYPRDKLSVRTKLKVPKELFTVIFVGKYDDNKGVMRLVEALKDIPDIGLILVGAGPHNPEGPNILFKGRVPHELIPEYLSAADAFVLPTGHEGSCNAIVEAMACGLPIITSKGEFNDDIVDGTNAIRIDPYDIDAIREAVVLLKEDGVLREKLSAGALRKAKELDINLRAKRITHWMEEQKNHHFKN